ncbi:GNAT family N-acetyltransferase [Candidatus Thorarchaeota archaeon]|nr:MAG: GNAT family N-acetyltransferase [Candidatus Thorarchaeota archaeon]
MKTVIRRWDRRKDVDFFKAAELEAFKGTLNRSEDLTERQILEKFRKMDEEDPIDLSNPSHEVLIVDSRARPQIALIWLCSREPFWRFKSRLTWIYNLYVVPELRRHGIARMLLQEAEKWTRKEGLVTIALHVIEWNAPARHLYEAMGYELVHTHNESCFYEKKIG